jgi:electron transfer flavoprotein beta subunit
MNFGLMVFFLPKKTNFVAQFFQEFNKHNNNKFKIRIMKALICIGHVPDTTSKIKFTEGDTKFDKTDIQYIIGPYEELALTRLLDIKDAGTDLHITCVNVGLAETEATLRKALSMGADEAVRVNADPTDAFFTAKQIAEVYKKGSYDFIVTGKESIDYNGGQVDGMIAEILGMASIPSASKLEFAGTTAKVEREIDGGKEVVEAVFPFVIAAQKGFAAEPRIPGMRGIMAARKKTITVFEPIAQDNVTKITKHYMPEAKSACKKVSPDNVEELVRLLHEEAKVI